ncbi:MAG: hypothetical protein DRN95_05665, partial [Candidatus Hydrothermarchaeota archaeon]
MKMVVTYSFAENFIERVAEFICENYLKRDKDLSRVVCVFGGKRPALFLRKKLTERIKGSFFPPRIFSIDEFIDYIVTKDKVLMKIGELEACYFIYLLAKEYLQELLSGRTYFSDFLPWGKEIVSFIEQLDLEDISDERLRNIEKSASIGYEIPENINRLLQNILRLRGAYHRVLQERGVYSRGMRYLEASRLVEQQVFDEFDKIIFCNFFYLHSTEKKIIKHICSRGKGICLFQGNQERWSVLKRNAEELGCNIKPANQRKRAVNFSLYRGFDMHSQVCLVRELLKKIPNKNNCVIVLPQPEAVIPLLSEVSCILGEFNVSLGYPFKRSTLFALFSALFRVQEEKKEGKYYTKSYLDVLRHPLVKNLCIGRDSAQMRVLVHKIEEVLMGEEGASIGGSLFLSLEDIESEGVIYEKAALTLSGMGITTSISECRVFLREIHLLFFKEWEQIFSFKEFMKKIQRLLDVLVEKSTITKFSFNLKALEKIYEITEGLKNASFSLEHFMPEEMWNIFLQKLESEIISFSGSPLRGTQILGLFETRSLNFDTVIIMDMNESFMPKLKIHEPLIPREVMLCLGLDRLEKEEEIQRYQFMRLISAAKDVYLIYAENEVNEKSRFIEELLWDKEKEENRLETITVPRINFNVKISTEHREIEKTLPMIEFLKKEIYSASRINTYLECPLMFYYRYVLGLEEKEDLLEGPGARHIGVFI